jgi:probable H4MPT-linked C1 transfer pathway protein
MTTALGLDIGGANLKAADPDGQVRVATFPMWQQHRELTDRLRSLSWIERPDLVGVTMTAELADCFETKADGIACVIDNVQKAFPQSEIRIWLTSGEFAKPNDAVELPKLVAAANWHALATWVGRAVPDGPAILIDTGSTTTDIIPLLDGFPMPSGLTDLERLLHAELVYTGVRRTPLCAVSPSVILNGTRIPLAAELFATTQDVYLVLGSIAENPENTDTPDGKPATIAAARRRIARMLCCDVLELTDEATDDIARQLARAQQDQLVRAILLVKAKQNTQRPAARRDDVGAEPHVILSGSGMFLAAQVAAVCGLTATVNLSEFGSPAVAEAACAFAVSRLVIERCRDDLLHTVSFHDTDT